MAAFLNPVPIVPLSRRHTSLVTSHPRVSRTRPSYRSDTRCAVNQDADSVESSALTAAAATFLLQRAADAYQKGGVRPRPFTVLEALVQLERAQKRHKFIGDPARLAGQWRLIFTGAPGKTLQTLYFPLRAHQTFRDGIFDNGVFFFGGAANFRVIGPMRWVTSRNRMEFTVNRLTVKIGALNWAWDGLDPKGDTLEGRSVKDLPFFTFFLLRDDLAAARGRSGGLALYARVPDDEHL